MKILVLLCVGLLMDQTEALKESRQNHTGENGNRSSIHTLDCGEGKRVLLVDVRIYFTGACNCSNPCYHWSSVANFELYLAECENKSQCTVLVQDARQTCGGRNRNAQYASLFYECSSAPAVLAMDRPGSTSGRTVAARFSSPDLQSSSSSWQCRVEASDCSNLTSTVELLIRNTWRQSSSFFSMRNIERLGRFNRQRNETTSVTPFSVTLHLVNRSRVHPAYVLVTADTSIIMTCGQRTAIPPTSFCTPITEQPPQTSIVGPIVGGAVAALVVIAVVVVIIVFAWRARSREKNTVEEVSAVSLPSNHLEYLNNAYEETEPQEDNHVADKHATPRNDLQSVHAGAASAKTSGDDKSYDVLGKKRPTADAKRDVIYHHLNQNGNPSDDVEYSYDHAGKSPKPDVITSAVYSSAAPVSPDGEAGPEDYECSYNRLGASRSPGVITDAVYHVVEPESPAAQAKQDEKVKAGAR